MAIYAPKPESNFVLAPVGIHKAILYSLIDVGTHEEKDMKGNPKMTRKLIAQFELHGKAAPLIDGKPPVYQRWLTFSMHEKSKLRQIVDAITGQNDPSNTYGDGIDVEAALGGCFQLQLVADKKPDGGETRKIGSVSPVDPDAPMPVRVNPLRKLFLMDGEFNAELYASLPEKLRAMIEKSPEFAALTGSPRVNEAAPFDDEVM
jgi:hypothetical protein